MQDMCGTAARLSGPIVKRDGSQQPFDVCRILSAVARAGAADLLLNELLRLVEEPLILILDDYHHLGRETPVHKMIDRLIQDPSDLLHLIVTARELPPLAKRLPGLFGARAGGASLPPPASRSPWGLRASASPAPTRSRSCAS